VSLWIKEAPLEKQQTGRYTCDLRHGSPELSSLSLLFPPRTDKQSPRVINAVQWQYSGFRRHTSKLAAMHGRQRPLLTCFVPPTGSYAHMHMRAYVAMHAISEKTYRQTVHVQQPHGSNGLTWKQFFFTFNWTFDCTMSVDALVLWCFFVISVVIP
jgi:hypothetical protein